MSGSADRIRQRPAHRGFAGHGEAHRSFEQRRAHGAVLAVGRDMKFARQSDGLPMRPFRGGVRVRCGALAVGRGRILRKSPDQLRMVGRAVVALAVVLPHQLPIGLLDDGRLERNLGLMQFVRQKIRLEVAAGSVRSPAPPTPGKSRYSRRRSRSGPVSGHAATCRIRCPCRAPPSSARRARRSTDDRDIPAAARCRARRSKFSTRDAGRYCGRRASRRRGRAPPAPDTRRPAPSSSSRDSALRNRDPRTANRGTKSSPDRLDNPPGCSRSLVPGRSRDCVPADRFSMVSRAVMVVS